ncbi:MAG: SUF system Fe-S cluster assembly regulator [Chromatiales bacterium]|nr:SUF system Fe-S cluster assembly regulator [Chromatiales bacterium]
MTETLSMLRISRLTDYGTMILVHLARQEAFCSASDVAGGTRLALPTVQKLLKLLTRAGLVRSMRGAGGGYQLAREPESIDAAEIISALEGPLGITECSSEESQCELEHQCDVSAAWRRIDQAIRSALQEVKLADLAQLRREFPLIDHSAVYGSTRAAQAPGKKPRI